MTRSILAVLTVLFIFTGASQAQSPGEVYSFAVHLENDGMFEAAAQQYLKFARENPTDRRVPAALQKAAECLVETGATEQAITVLEALIDTYPNIEDACGIGIRLGRLYLKITRFEESNRAFTNVVVNMPECPVVYDALLGKGEALMALNRHNEAIEIFSSLVQNFLESPAAPRAAYHTAFCQGKLGLETQALRTYQRVCTDFPGNPLAGFASLEAARMFVERGDLPAAVEFYKNAKRYEAKVIFVPACEEGATVLSATGRHAEALAWYEEMLMRSDLDDPRSAFIKAVEAAYHAGDFEGVRRLAGDYNARYPKTFSPQLVYFTALAGLERREYDSVLEDVATLETVAPGTHWAWSARRVRGDALFEMGRVRDAVFEWRRFVSLVQDSLSRVQTLDRIADVQLSVVGDTTAALATLLEQLDTERRAIPSEILRVGGVFERVGNYQGARDLYVELFEKFPLSDEAEAAEAGVKFLDEFAVTDYEAAAGEMDRTAYEIARMDDWDGLIRVIEARIDVVKEFESAGDLTRGIKKSARKTEHYPRLLYLEGLSRSKLSMIAFRAGREDAARDEMKDAIKVWNELTKDHGSSEWAARAASMKLVLRSDVEGVIDTTEVKRVLARYPQHPDRASLFELAGDYCAGNGDLEGAGRYYTEAAGAGRDALPLRYKAAAALARGDKNEEAYDAFESISDDDDGRVGLLAAYEAGKLLRKLGRFDNAVAHFDRVANRDPKGSFGASAMLQAADCLYLKKEYERALDRYEQTQTQSLSAQRQWEISYRIALTLEQLGRKREALARLEENISSAEGGAQRPRAYNSAAALARSLGETGRQAEILEAFVAEIKTGENVAAAERELVRLYFKTAETDKAARLAGRIAGNAGKDDAEAKALLAMANCRQGRMADAQRLRRDVEKIAGADSPLLDGIDVESAKYHFDQKSFGEAVEALAPFAGECDGPGVCEEGRYYHTVSLMGAGRIDEAITAARSFFRDYPLSEWGPRLHLKLGNVLVQESRVSESLLHYEEAAETTADSLTAHLSLKNLGVAYQDLKRWLDAERLWIRLLNRFPDSEFAPEAALNVARCKMERGDYTGAIAAYEASLPRLDSETRARAYYWMGTSYEQLGDFQSAVVNFLKVPYLAGSGGLWVVTAELKAAECYVRISNVDAAREIYERVMQKYGAGSNWGKLAKRGLDSLNGTEPAQDPNAGGSDQ